MRSVLILILLSFSFTVLAQSESDLALWSNIYLSKKINKRFLAHLNTQSRFNENISQLNLVYGDVGITTRLNKNLKFSVDYVYVRKAVVPDEFSSSRHQYYAFIAAKREWGRAALHYRLMIQGQIKDVQSSDKGRYPEYTLRNKATFKYDLNIYLTGYLAQELFSPLDGNSPYEISPFYLNRSRTTAGIFYNISTSSAFELYYMFQSNFNVKRPNFTYVIGLGFNKDF